MSSSLLGAAVLGLTICASLGAEFTPATQQFQQEVARHFTGLDGAPTGPVQLVECAPDGVVRAFAAGQWFEFRSGHWNLNAALRPQNDSQFVFAGESGQPLEVNIPWREVRQILRFGVTNWVVTPHLCLRVREGGESVAQPLPKSTEIRQMALSPRGVLHAASSDGLLALDGSGWKPVEVLDGLGRAWAVENVLGVAFDSSRRMWVACKAGVACQVAKGWQFYEGKDGLPWNDFTGISPGTDGKVWFTTHGGVIRFDGSEWQYRQGPRWLPNDDVAQAAADAQGNAWFATTAGIGCIERRPMTLAEKAEFYEGEIERYIKRTPFGYVAAAPLSKPGDKTSAHPQDDDNDGLWTSMYGAGECFAYAATKDPKAKERAKHAFEALRFLQKVTQGCEHAPPKGYIARTIRPVDWPDPNIGRIESDRQEQQHDKLWKAYEPRWPKSADGKWFWKSDTSSDELDGHYFFYPLYYDLCADTEAERERVREVVRDVTDHLLTHDFLLIDHDGKPTRWGVYGPQYLNRDPFWWGDRGLKSLSMLSYLAVAEHVTGDLKYAAASRELIDHDGYAQNAMYPKVQNGPGSGNQSDDEMAFMCFYGVLRYSKDDELKTLMRASFYRYWLNEAPEMNPFFNFTYAALNLGASATNPWGSFSIKPWPGWHEDAMATLYGFPLDRLNWPMHNSHRLDVLLLPPVRASELDSDEQGPRRGNRVNDKVLPVENRHFNHWNTDPWELDYGGDGNELAPGTVFLLPYYMGLYYGFIQKPNP
ncbi:MAG TPA: hypothetical protein VGR14_16235 [Verrucomicrobiae bacterium]|nr:hypothetical protein [Verrucomicrobiae bacterium]